MTYTAAEQKMAAQLESELKYGMKSVIRSTEDMQIIASLNQKSHAARYGN